MVVVRWLAGTQWTRARAQNTCEPLASLESAVVLRPAGQWQITNKLDICQLSTNDERERAGERAGLSLASAPATSSIKNSRPPRPVRFRNRTHELSANVRHCTCLCVLVLQTHVSPATRRLSPLDLPFDDN